MRETSLRIKGLVEQEVAALGGDHRRVFLAGLSQGCTTVLATHLWHEVKVGGLICVHGQHKAVVDWDNTDVAKKNETPIFVCHGSEDEILDLKNAEKSYEYLTRHGFQIDL